MSVQEQNAGSEPVKTPKYKLLPKARKQLLSEFTLNDETLELISNQLGQEPYNMINGKYGRKASTRWSRPIEQIWSWNNGKPDSRGRSHFNNSLIVDGQTFSRRDFITEPVFRANLHYVMQTQFKKLGYNRCYVQNVERFDELSNAYETLLVQVPV